ncbi:GNAT family N-acetyltransferase [Anaerolentibacter hominis]|uniref:GNAT family N-acetyltransferase n=1 Tax=Anaerolentibacter hominis TaxID=3079009 RepID=UPI0031B8989F
MDYRIREMKREEYPLLERFLYEAIFQRAGAEPLPEAVIFNPDLYRYIDRFGEKMDDYCLCAEADGQVVGAVWVRTIPGYGSINETTPELAISLLPEVRGRGIGTELLHRILLHLKESGYPEISLSVQKDNYARNMYLGAGFQILKETEEEWVMVCRLEEV